MTYRYQQSVFKRYHSDEHFSEFLPRKWRQKSAGIDMERYYVTVTLCIPDVGVGEGVRRDVSNGIVGQIE